MMWLYFGYKKYDFEMCFEEQQKEFILHLLFHIFLYLLSLKCSIDQSLKYNCLHFYICFYPVDFTVVHVIHDSMSGCINR